MKEVVLITGANGMVAKALAKELDESYRVRFLTRQRSGRRDNEYLWDVRSGYIDSKALVGVNHIIHLAGNSIAGGRWSKRRRESIVSSRVDSIKLIADELLKQNLSIDSFISSSAVGYYGTVTTDEIFTEESKSGNDFLSGVCCKWEAAAMLLERGGLSKRIAIVRTGVVLAKEGGVLPQMIRPIRYYIGSALGSGSQYMPWIHIDDLCGIFRSILWRDDITGTFNGVAPEHITNSGLTEAVAKQINRPLFMPNIPKFLIRGVLGELSSILLEGSRVSSSKIEGVGYQFKFRSVEEALRDLL